MLHGNHLHFAASQLKNITYMICKLLVCRFSGDFGQEKEILRCIINYLDATKAGLLTHLLGDGGPVNIVYQDYDWSINS
jgi:hypothetical protein